MKTPPPSRGLRPLTDLARGALFNILAGKVVDAGFLDLFAGTGAVGIEALSRGAKSAAFVEINRQTAAILRENLKITGFTEQAEVYAIDAVRALSILAGKASQFDIIFLGAPYDSPLLEAALAEISAAKFLPPAGVLIAEHRKQHALAENYGQIERFRQARYGETVFDFFRIKK